jgi:hypothetical protein
MEFVRHASMADVLFQFQQPGQIIKVTTRQGTSFEGKVKMIGDKVIHLTEIRGLEMFDVVIDKEDISAIMFRSK